MILEGLRPSEDWEFRIGDTVKKKSGSWWKGKVVGFYSTKQTPWGYAVQMEGVINGPVQIYPENALILANGSIV